MLIPRSRIKLKWNINIAGTFIVSFTLTNAAFCHYYYCSIIKKKKKKESESFLGRQRYTLMEALKWVLLRIDFGSRFRRRKDARKREWAEELHFRGIIIRSSWYKCMTWGVETENKHLCIAIYTRIEKENSHKQTNSLAIEWRWDFILNWQYLSFKGCEGFLWFLSVDTKLPNWRVSIIG